jgi:hypothetical protein
MKTAQWVLAGLLWPGVASAVRAGETEDARPVVAERPFAVTFAVEMASTYYWRGFNLTDDTWAVQPGIQARHLASGLSFSLWSSHAMGNRRIAGDADEVDLTMGWDRPLGRRLEVALGGTLYAFPRWNGENEWSRELFAGLSLLEVLLAPSATYYHDFDQGNGGYLAISGSHAFRRLDLKVESGFSFRQYTEKSGFTDLVAELSCGLDLGGQGLLAPFLRLGVIRDRERNPDDAMLWFGFNLSWEQ